MKKDIATRLAFITCWALLSTFAFDKPIRGSKRLEVQTRTPGTFSAVRIHFPAKLILTAKRMPKVELTTDANLLSRIETQIEQDTLIISANGWLKPSMTPEIRIDLPFLTRIETHGYGHYTLEDIDSDHLEIVNTVGSMVIKGQAERLDLSVNTGSVDASDLLVQRAHIQFESWGKVQAHVSEYLATSFYGNGTLIYQGTPEITVSGKPRTGTLVSLEEARTQKERPKTPHVSLKLFNNRMHITRLLINGPEDHPFSYGLSIGPLFRQAEIYPVGTKIYRVKKDDKPTLLHEVTDADQGTQVSLFRGQQP